MTTTFWVYAGGQWRALEVDSGRVRGWERPAAFCVARRGRLQVVRAAPVLEGLKALQRRQPAAVRDGTPLPTRRPARTRPPPRARCCCARGGGAAERNALVQLNLNTQCAANAPPASAGLPASEPQKTDAAVQAGTVALPTDGEGRRPEGGEARADRGEEVVRATSNSASESEEPVCKELVVSEADVRALRGLLSRGGPLGADVRRFDACAAYRRALFYAINPLVCLERSKAAARTLARQRELRAFTTSLGLRAVDEVPPAQPYRMRRRRDRGRPPTAPANKSPRKPLNKSAEVSSSESISQLSNESSWESESSNAFQMPRRQRRSSRNLRSSRASAQDPRTKLQRDSAARAKYMVGRHKPKDDVTVISDTSDSDSPRSRQTNTKRTQLKEINDQSQSESNRSRGRNTRRNALSKGVRDLSDDTDRRRSLRSRNDDKIMREIDEQEKENREDVRRKRDSSVSDKTDVWSTSRSRETRRENRAEKRRHDDSVSPSILGSKPKVQRKDNANNNTNNNVETRQRNSNGRYARDKRTDRRKSDRVTNNNEPKYPSKENGVSEDRKSPSSERREIQLRSKKSVSPTKADKSNRRVEELGLSSRSPRSKEKSQVRAREENGGESEGSGRKREKESREESAGEKRRKKPGGEPSRRPQRVAATSIQSESLRREYSSLEDHAIVQWVALGARARRVNGNAVWRELQEQFARIAGRPRSWHSLRNRYLRGILPALGALALPPSTVSALRAGQAKGAIKSRRRPPRPSPLLAAPAVRSAWGARPRPGGSGGGRRLPATSSSEAQRAPRPSPRRRSPPRPAKDDSKPIKSSKDNASSPTYSDVTRRFASRLAASTPEGREGAEGGGSPSRKTRKLFNPKAAM